MGRDEAGEEERHPLNHSTSLLCLQGILQGLTRGKAPWERNCICSVVRFSQFCLEHTPDGVKVSGLDLTQSFPEAQLGATRTFSLPQFFLYTVSPK